MRRGRPRKGRDPRLFPLLRELGITKRQSSDWQRLAAIPEDEFERRLEVAKRDPKQMTTAKLLRGAPLPAQHAMGAERLIEKVRRELARLPYIDLLRLSDLIEEELKTRCEKERPTMKRARRLR